MLPGNMAAFRTSRFEVRNTARSTGSVRDLALFTNLRSLMLPGRSGIAPMRSLMLPVRSGIAPVRSGIAPVRSLTLPVDLAVFQTSRFEVPNTARSTGSVRDHGSVPDLV